MKTNRNIDLNIPYENVKIYSLRYNVKTFTFIMKLALEIRVSTRSSVVSALCDLFFNIS